MKKIIVFVLDIVCTGMFPDSRRLIIFLRQGHFTEAGKPDQAINLLTEAISALKRQQALYGKS